ncbi:Zinc transporter 5 [Blattella germanica]|nr:Zinc transporter 5 [Blattella germanica]
MKVSGVGAPAVYRGTLLFLGAVISLLFLDHDEGQEHPGNSHAFSNISSWLGFADHKFGVMLLLVILLVKVGVNAVSKRVAADVGGVKRLHSLVTLTEGVVLVPWTIVVLISQGNGNWSLTSVVIPLVLIATMIFIVNYYVDVVCVQRLDVPRVARLGSVSLFLWALLAALLWQGLLFSKNELKLQVSEDHMISGGSLIACLLFILAALGLTATTKGGARGSFIGYSASGLPLYNFTNSALHQTSRSILLLASSFLRQILTDQNSRRIFYFLCLNLVDSQIFQGTASFTRVVHKYGRIEDLSGFVNGLFLLVISLFVFSEAVSRLFDPPHISTQRLLMVSIGGLCVNLVGILAFRHNHIHGHNHSHGDSHGHSHAGSHGHSHNSNMEGVFLHVLADTFGSVGVILSSILIDQFGWYIADPICSIFIAVLIFMSVLPLLKNSALVLVLRTPTKVQDQLPAALSKVCAVKGVEGIRQPHFWQHSSDMIVGTIHVQALLDASEQEIIQEVTAIFKEIGFYQFSVQVEKEQYFTHMAGLSTQLKTDFGFGNERRDNLIMIKAI